MSEQKPLLGLDELIEHMKAKGIQFNIINEDGAKEFLQNHNYYFKLASYRKNYDKAPCGKNAGKYLRLEFAYLQEISTIDCKIRYLILNLCLDVEHALKLFLVNDIENNPDEDGYNIVNVWDKSYYSRGKLYKQQHNSYNSSMINRYHPYYPIWALLEIVSFGDLCSLIECYNSLYPGRVTFDTKLLNPIRSLRNACAHNNCLINNLRSKEIVSPNKTMVSILKSIGVINKHVKATRVLNRPIHDFMCLLVLYPTIVKSKREKEICMDNLKQLLYKRMLKNREYFIDNEVIRNNYKFIHKVFQGIKQYY